MHWFWYRRVLGKWSILIAVGMFCFLVPVSAAGYTNPDSTEVKSLLDRGDEHYGNFENDLALTAYEEAFQIDSTSFNVLSRLARAANDLGKDMQFEGPRGQAEAVYNKAVDYAEKLAVQFPSHAESHFYLAVTKGNLGLFLGGRHKMRLSQEVHQHCRDAMKLDGNNPLILVMYGVFHRELATMSWMEKRIAETLLGGMPDVSREQAIDFLSKAVDLSPNLHVARYEFALALITVGRNKEAVFHLNELQTLPVRTSQDRRNNQLAERLALRIAQ